MGGEGDKKGIMRDIKEGGDFSSCSMFCSSFFTQDGLIQKDKEQGKSMTASQYVV